MNPADTDTDSAFDTDSNIIYIDNLLPVEYTNNSYYHNHSYSIFDYVNHYIADNLGQIIYDDTENMIALNVAPIYDYTMTDGQEYREDQELFITVPTAAESESESETEMDKEAEETDYSTLVCEICNNLLVNRCITCSDACQREYVNIKSLDNYKY